MSDAWEPVCPLSEDETQQAYAFGATIDLYNIEQVLHYGSACENMMEEFMDRDLLSLPSSAKTKAYHELDDLIKEIAAFNRRFVDADEEETRDTFLNAYQAEVRSFKRAVSYLEMYQKEIEKHLSVLQDAEKLCLRIIRTYDMYILAARHRIAQEKTEPTASDSFHEANRKEDHALAVDRLRRRADALCVSQKIPEQTIGSIHVIEQDENILYNSIGAIQDHALPLWQNGVVLAMNTHMEDDQVKDLDTEAFARANTTIIKSLKKFMN